MLCLMGRFLIHENVPSHMAYDIIIIPREGDVIQPFKKGTFSRAVTAGQSSSGQNSYGERARLEPVVSETGFQVAGSSNSTQHNASSAGPTPGTSGMASLFTRQLRQD